MSGWWGLRGGRRRLEGERAAEAAAEEAEGATAECGARCGII